MDRLIRNPFQDFDYQGEDFVSEPVLQIYNWIDQNLVDRDDWWNVLRSSAASSCVLRRWLQGRRIPGRRTAPRSIVNFALGDGFEHVIKHFIKFACVGPGRLYSEVNFGRVVDKFVIQKREFDVHDQIEVKIKIGPLTVLGHLDGMGKRNSDQRWEQIEAKSASNYSFKKFLSEGPVDHLKQAHSNMMSEEARALGVDSTRYFYGRKETGHIATRLVKFSETIADVVAKEFVISMAPTAPQAPYPLLIERDRNGFPTGFLKAKTFPCASACPYLNTPHCHNGLRKKLVKGSDGIKRPVYIKDVRNVQS